MGIPMPATAPSPLPAIPDAIQDIQKPPIATVPRLSFAAAETLLDSGKIAAFCCRRHAPHGR
ncbi:MAG: hypothetical protein OXU61_11150 [Gammaproteobacteria bacterium]|nr:hypothetical protein [Gammaproteobacteria bacterium]